ncbi:MAG: PadR family transcriptional regulator [Anaerolineae bacterium]|jgi:DNA-binding PadR family transcriptional regulator|nr:PadR family transcriptional regulator [Anaerolineae bacterium]
MSVRNSLLGLLAQQPRHGYELHAAFEAVVGGQANWDVKPGQIYTTLARLEEAGLVAEEGVEQGAGPEKRIFAITEEGRRELADWMAQPVPSEHQRDEFFLKLMLCVATGIADPRRLIYTQRGHLYRELHTITGRRTACDPRRQLAQILLFDQVIMHLEANLRWLDIVEQRLDEIKRQPAPKPQPKPRGRPRKEIAIERT